MERIFPRCVDITMTLQDLVHELKHLADTPSKHSQASHASKRGGMPDRFAKEFDMQQEGYDKVSKSLGKDWGQGRLRKLMMDLKQEAYVPG